jgi:hypothetical protein
VERKKRVSSCWQVEVNALSPGRRYKYVSGERSAGKSRDGAFAQVQVQVPGSYGHAKQ